MDKIDVEERKKIFDLMKDRELGGNIDWMYCRGDKPDLEEFLLGKSVDKMITEATSTNAEGSGSIISERIKANVALDMQAKMREDPLFAIRKKEEDARRRLLENPVKMKQLEKLVEQQRQKKAEAIKKAKKSRKARKNKKTMGRESSSSDSEDELVNKYLTILTQKKQRGDQVDPHHRHPSKAHTKNGRSKNHHQENCHEQQLHRKQLHDKDFRDSKNKKRHEREFRSSTVKSKSAAYQGGSRRRNSRGSESEHEKSERSGESSEPEFQKRVYGLIKSVRHGMNSTSPLPDSEDQVKSESTKRRLSSSSSDTSRSRSQSPRRTSHQNHIKKLSSPPSYKSRRKCSSTHYRSQSPDKKRIYTSPKSERMEGKSLPKKNKSKSPPRRQLTAEERDRKLQEMMDNAKWRDLQRLQNVQRYKHEAVKEQDRLSSYQGDANFLSSMMSEHASSSSVEDRLKRNKYNIQRTPAALDKKFTQH